ncbi:MAG: sensor histidine kinase, partial [Flavobacterium sp.]
STIRFEFFNDLETSTRFEESFEMKLYFIVSELLNNILKHSKATAAKVYLTENKQQLIITVQDNGKGFDSQDKKSLEGFGLNRIKARINNLKGKFFITSQANQGTTITLLIPIL